MKSTKHPTSSVVILGKFFGILHFKSTDTCLNKFLSIILCVPVVTIYIYIIYLNAYDIVILNYKVGTKVLKILNSLYVLLASCAVVFKYSYYLINSRRIWNVVEKIYELTSTSSRGICKSCWKFWIVFATISFCIFSLNFKAVSDSGLPLPVAWIIFHSLYQQHVSAELYVIGTFLKELRKAYTDVNNNLLSLRYNRTGKRENFNLRKWRILSEYHSLRQEINSLCKASNVVFIPGLAANILIELYFMVGACHICFLHFLIGYQNKDYNLVLMSWMAVSVLFKTGYIMLFINMWMDINNEVILSFFFVYWIKDYSICISLNRPFRPISFSNASYFLP